MTETPEEVITEVEIPEVEMYEVLSLMNHEVSLTDSISFVIQLTVVLFFSTALVGFGIKKLLQIIRG